MVLYVGLLSLDLIYPNIKAILYARYVILSDKIHNVCYPSIEHDLFLHFLLFELSSCQCAMHLILLIDSTTKLRHKHGEMASEDESKHWYYLQVLKRF